MFITEKRVHEAYRAMPEAYSCYGRFDGTGAKSVRMYYLMDWYKEYFKDISKEEKEEIEGIIKAAFRRFTESDWDYIIRCSSGVYAKMALDIKKRKYLNQLRQGKLFVEVISYLECCIEKPL